MDTPTVVTRAVRPLRDMPLLNELMGCIHPISVVISKSSVPAIVNKHGMTLPIDLSLEPKSKLLLVYCHMHVLLFSILLMTTKTVLLLTVSLEAIFLMIASSSVTFGYRLVAAQATS